MPATLRAIKSNARTLLAFGILALCAGCGTVFNGMLGTPGPYGGVRTDITAIKAGGTAVCMVLDLPFSAVADTLLLPVDLPNAPPLSDPLKDWKCLGSKISHSDEPPGAITQDVKQYLAEQKSHHGHPSVLGTTFYEDGTGRHAVRMEVYFDGYAWHYILIYDKSNVRTKAIKYIIGRYMC